MVKTSPKRKGRQFKSHRFQKSNHVKGWCGPSRVRSPGDFDGLDTPVCGNLPNGKPTSHGGSSHYPKKKHSIVLISLFLLG